MNTNDNNSRKISAPVIEDLSCALESEIGELPELMSLVPMAELNSFPNLVSSICVDESVSRQAIQKSIIGDQCLALFALKSFDIDTGSLMKEDFHPIGVAVRILEMTQNPSGSGLKVTVHGLCRVSLEDVINDPARISPMARISRWPEYTPKDYNIDHLILEAKRLFAEVIKLIPGLPVNLFKLNQLLEDKPGTLADLIMASLPLKPNLKAEFLMIDDLEERYLALLKHLMLELSNRKLGQAISERIEQSLDRRHKEMQLREQIKAIKAELGESEEDDDPLAELKDKLATIQLSDGARTAADREFQRLKTTSPQSAEYSSILNFLDWICALPWASSTEEATDLAKAKEILDRDHHGLEPVKKRLLEFLAVQKLTGCRQAPILCLTGPPGVGKTSLGRSVAEALGRKFVRLSLGGMRDEAEIRGHRRTYVGARPGRFIAGLKKAGVNNPVFLLDEIDKLTANHAGDPSAALLEVLDPEQNDTFTDSFLEVPFDLSKVLFIVTANVLDNIPAPLRDRLEVIEVNGYSFEEKMGIARGHLWPKELAKHGLDKEDVELSDDALEAVVASYTWESGCRELGRQLGALARNRAVAKVESLEVSRTISTDDITAILGPPKRRVERREKNPQTGVVTGLAWTAGGGDIMFIEAVAMPGQGGLSLTGQLGEVMRESAQAAVSYVRSRLGDWFLSEGWFKEKDLHIHLPQGAIPKDGPSAGVGLATAVVSLVSGLRVKADVAMTGEISLRGLVLPVGGLKEKLLAAKRAGMSTVLVPARNRPEISQLPSSITDGLEIIEVDTLDQVLEKALLTPERIFGGEVFKPGAASMVDPDLQPAPPVDSTRVWPGSSSTIMAEAPSRNRLVAA